MPKALIFAGGTGVRMNSRSKPKQFLELHGKPIIIYTIEHFERHTEIDEIAVVCIEEWIPELKRSIEKHGIKKVNTIVSGGVTAFESIYKGLCRLKETCRNDEIVLIHDGVRPLITQELISSNIDCARKNTSAITVDYARETIISCTDEQQVVNVFPREQIKIAKAPQTFIFNNIYNAYKEAYANGEEYIDSCELMKSKGFELYTVLSSEYNIKITTPSDFYIFRAITDALENSQIFGLEP